MSDGRKNNGGAREGAGSPGYGKLEFIKRKVEQHSELWWKTFEEMIKSESKDEKKTAFVEFNKIQCKMIPQDITTGGKELPGIIMYPQKHDDKTENTLATPTETGAGSIDGG